MICDIRKDGMKQLNPIEKICANCTYFDTCMKQREVPYGYVQLRNRTGR